MLRGRSAPDAPFLYMTVCEGGERIRERKRVSWDEGDRENVTRRRETVVGERKIRERGVCY